MFVAEHNVPHDFPKILPVRPEGMLLVRLAIAAFAFLYFVKCLRQVRVVRREHARFVFDAYLLDLRPIKVEILLTQRPDTHQFHLSFEDVDKHGQLINPILSQPTTPSGNPVIIVKLTPSSQFVVIVDVCLQILGVSIHRPELIDQKMFPVLTYPIEFHDHAITWMIRCGLPPLLGNHAKTIMNIELRNHVEATIVKPTQHFRTRKYLSRFLGAPIVKPPRQANLGTKSMPNEIEEIQEISNELGIFAIKLNPTFRCGIKEYDKITVLLQLFVGTAQKSVHIPDAIQMVFGKQHLRLTIRYRPTLLHIVVQPFGPFLTPRHIRLCQQLLQLYRGIHQIEPRGVLGLLAGKVFHRCRIVLSVYDVLQQ